MWKRDKLFKNFEILPMATLKLNCIMIMKNSEMNGLHWKETINQTIINNKLDYYKQ